MDAKLSSFPLASTLAPSDIIPIISAGANKTITAGVMGLNMPNLGNRGITRNTPIEVSTISVPVTGTLMVLPELIQAYTVGAGTDGQEITLVSLGINTVNIASGTVSSVSMAAGSTVSLIYIGSLLKWVVKGYHNSVLV